MIAQLRQRAEREGVHVEACVGDGMALPLPDSAFDAAFSMFGLMFFPDRHRGFSELARVLTPGGRAVVASWVPVDRVALMADVYRTLGALLPSLPFGGARTPLGTAAEVREEMAAAGLDPVEVREITHAFEAPSVDAFWEVLERSTPPIHAVREAVGPDAWAKVRRDLVEALRAKWGTGPQEVPMIANLGIGRRA
jgi:SAM-dependent methyltransferase